MRNIKIVLLSTLTTMLCACSGFFDKDNTPTPSPLVNFTQEVKVHSLWSRGTGEGVGSEYLHLAPAFTGNTVVTASKDGTVTATNKTTGKIHWRVNTKVPISGGASANDNLVVVGSREGDVVALRAIDGKILWQNKVASEILAPPAVSNDIVLAKTINGQLSGLSAQDGHALWHYEQTEPTLILRGASAPLISGSNVIVGFANGNLAKLTLREGSLHWQQTMATPEGSFSIQRMIDIDANPIIHGNRVYAATYQGRITAMDLGSGKTYWTHDISSFSGIAADSDRVYVADTKSHIWAFDADTGTVDWRQTQLEARNVTGPAIIGNYIVVGDEEGYLHWISKQDGHFVARVRINGSGILAAPIVDNNILYVVTRDGQLTAYTLG